MCMQQTIKTFLSIGLLAFGLQTSWAYSLGGPIGNGGDSWQVPTIGYGLPGDLNAPKNISEEYRRNTPVMYYAFDANFFGYFGPDGAASVDGAFTILNSLTNVNQYSSQLSEFPVESRQINYQAQALGLLDLKSITLSLMVEQLGLTDPVRYTWTLHDRFLPSGGTCPIDEEYLVVQRNFDYFSTPLNQLQYSPYVNNTLYSYQIYEACTGPNPLALAVPYSVDPLADIYSPVASLGSIFWGEYYTGLTRDDMAGLRYLLSTNNVNWESAPSGSILGLITTNTTIQQSFPPFGNNGTNSTGTNAIGFYYFTGGTNGGFGYGDLAAFRAYISTNNPGTVQAAYPGVIIDSYSNTLVWSSNQTYSYSYQVPLKSPYGTPPVLTITTNYTWYWQPYYYYQFANVFPNHVYTNQAKLVTQTVAPPLGSPYGTAAVTNTAVVYTNMAGGDFFVLPPFFTNVCPLDIIDSSHFNVVATTNYLSVTDTNVATSTNGTSTTSVSNTVYEITYFTNYSYVIHPVTCTEVANATGLYQGIGKISYVRADYDSLLGQYYQPITNYYTMVSVTNSQASKQTFRRIVTEPDFLFSAEDLTGGPNTIPANPIAVRNLNFDEGNVLPNLAGPGTITPSTTIAFNKAGPVYFNSPLFTTMDGTSYFNQTPGGDISDLFYAVYYVWASYDGTTNAPIVYPNGTSLDNLENQVLIQVSPSSLPQGFTDVPYQSVTFTATGGSFTQPYTWSAVDLPAGLTLSSAGVLSGTPTQAGTFNFTLMLTDYVGRKVQWIYTITIQ